MPHSSTYGGGSSLVLTAKFLVLYRCAFWLKIICICFIICTCISCELLISTQLLVRLSSYAGGSSPGGIGSGQQKNAEDAAASAEGNRAGNELLLSCGKKALSGLTSSLHGVLASFPSSMLCCDVDASLICFRLSISMPSLLGGDARRQWYDGTLASTVIVCTNLQLAPRAHFRLKK